MDPDPPGSTLGRSDQDQDTDTDTDPLHETMIPGLGSRSHTELQILGPLDPEPEPLEKKKQEPEPNKICGSCIVPASRR